MNRRNFIKSGSALGLSLGLPSLPSAWAADAPAVFRWVPAQDLTILDPTFTTAHITQVHGALIFDTLYGLDAKMQPHPQMASGHTVENNGLQWTITLRDQLWFHDGTPVRASDVVASLKRWGQRDLFGRTLFGVTQSLTAVDDKTIRFTLTKPFPLLTFALARPETEIAAIMPERLANQPLTQPLKEMVGSGPFRFVADQWEVGAKVVYDKFERYVPRTDAFAPQYTAGPKIAHVDQVLWRIIPDAATALAALQAGEVDGAEAIDLEFIDMLKTDPNIQLIKNSVPALPIIRFNQLQAPFNNAAIRRAVLSAVSQTTYLQAMYGTQYTDYWNDKVGFFAPESPMASDAGMVAVTGSHDLDKARAAIKAAGYQGEKVVLMDPADNPPFHAAALVTQDLFTKLGMTVEVQSMDWGTLIQRRNNQAPVSQGGWSATFTSLSGINNFNPAGQLGLRGNGKDAWFGWPTSPQLEALRDQWFNAPDLAAQKRICEQIQSQAFEDVPYVPLGAIYQVMALRKGWSDMQVDGVLFFTLRHA